MKRLTNQAFWSKNYGKKNKRVRYANSKFSSMSFYFFDLCKTIKPFMPKKGKILEIGCAPGNVLVELAKKFNLEPHGVEYIKSGCMLTQETFSNNGFNKNNVICSDFFSQTFQKENKAKYDVVCSFGFIEHFEDTNKVIGLHSALLKKNGLLIIVIPNFTRGNKLFIKQEILDKHNLKIMNIPELEKCIPDNIRIDKVKYFGGPFNIGLYNCKTKFFENLRFAAFIGQRIILDPLFFLLRKIGINLKNKYFSPSIILIGHRI